MQAKKLSAEELARVAERANNASPGPWRSDYERLWCREFKVGSRSAQFDDHPLSQDILNAYFCAQARADIPALLAHIAAQERELEGCREPAPPGLPTLIPRDERERRIGKEAAEAALAAFKREAIEAIEPFACIDTGSSPDDFALSIMTPEITCGRLRRIAALHARLSPAPAPTGTSKDDGKDSE